MSLPIIQSPTKELVDRINQYNIVYDSDARTKNNKNKKLFEEELKKLAWVRLTSNAIITKQSEDASNGIKKQDKLKLKNKYINANQYLTISNIVKNKGNSKRFDVGGFEELYSTLHSGYKYRPNIFIEGINISYMGDLKSLIKTTVTLVASSVEDFEIITELYANPNISIIVEWGYNTKRCLNNLLKPDEFDKLWKNPSNYNLETLAKKTNGDYGITNNRVTNISWTINSAGLYTFNIELMSRGVSALYLDNKNESFNKKTSIFLTALEYLPENKQKELDKKIKKIKKRLSKSGTSEYENARKSLNLYNTYITVQSFINNINRYNIYLTNKWMSLSSVLKLVNTIFGTELIQPYAIYIKYNKFITTKKYENLIFIINDEKSISKLIYNKSKTNEQTNPELPISNKNNLSNFGELQLNTGKTQVNIDNMLINITVLFNKLKNTKSVKSILETIMHYITDNIISESELQLINIENNQKNKTGYSWLIFDKKIANTYMENNSPKPLMINVFGKNSIVTSFTANASLSDGLAQTSLYSSANTIDNTIGNIWNIKNDKYINYLRKKEYASKSSESTSSTEENDDEKTLKKNIEDFIDSEFEDITLHACFNAEASHYYSLNAEQIKYVKYHYNKEENKKPSKLTAIFPMKIDVTFLFGNTLLNYGNLLTYNYLPNNYKYYDRKDAFKTKYSPAFFISEITHNISGFKWETSISSNILLIKSNNS